LLTRAYYGSLKSYVRTWHYVALRTHVKSYTSQIRVQKRFTITEVAADSHELIRPVSDSPTVFSLARR